VELVGVDEGGEVVGVGRGHDVQGVLIELQVSLLTDSEAYVEGELPALRFLLSSRPGML
jgi:hypothetical protein